MKKNNLFKFLVFSFLLVFYTSRLCAQTAVQSFGQDPGFLATPDFSEDFIPKPDGSGTTYARTGPNEQNAPIALLNSPNLLNTSGAYLRATASTSTSVTKVSPVIAYDAGLQFYTSMQVLFGDQSGTAYASSGTWVFSQGKGNVYSNNGAFSGAQAFAALQFTFMDEGVVDVSYRNNDKWSSGELLKTFLQQAKVYTIEIIGNNNSLAELNYAYNGVSYSVNSGTYDLFINGELIGRNLPKAQLPIDTEIESLTFMGRSSVNNVANIFMDDIIVYNEVPAAISSDAPSIIIKESTIPDFQADINGTDVKTIVVDGVNLTDEISLHISGEDAAFFSLSTNKIAQEQGVVSHHAITVNYAPTELGTHQAVLSFDSPGATQITRTLNGIAIDPSLFKDMPDVIITEVYGGGGNSGAAYTHDYIELYNTTNQMVDISGWSLQYYAQAADGEAKEVVVIPDAKMIASHSYFLIQGAGGANGEQLPVPDLIAEMAMAANGGKVILYDTSEVQTIDKTQINSIIKNAHFIDYVPYGKEAVPVWGSPMATNPTAVRSAGRKKQSNMYVYTETIGDDFENQTPSPQNSNLTTVNKTIIKYEVYLRNGNIHFNTVADLPVELYNTFGQLLYSGMSNEGTNKIEPNEKGLLLLKLGSQITKLIL